MSHDDRERLQGLARDLVATAVGFAVLGVNRAQVERRRLGIDLDAVRRLCDRDRHRAAERA